MRSEVVRDSSRAMRVSMFGVNRSIKSNKLAKVVEILSLSVGRDRLLEAPGMGNRFRSREGWISNVSSGQVLKIPFSLLLSLPPLPPLPRPLLSMSHQDALNQASSKMDMSSGLFSTSTPLFLTKFPQSLLSPFSSGTF